MKEDKRGDATESQHRPVAVSQCLLMIYSCGDDGERKSMMEREGHTHCYPFQSHQLWPEMFYLNCSQLMILLQMH